MKSIIILSFANIAMRLEVTKGKRMGKVSMEISCENCIYCGKSSGDGLALRNYDERNFTKLPSNSIAHLECYVEHCVQEAVIKLSVGQIIDEEMRRFTEGFAYKPRDK